MSSGSRRARLRVRASAGGVGLGGGGGGDNGRGGNTLTGVGDAEGEVDPEGVAEIVPGQRVLATGLGGPRHNKEAAMWQYLMEQALVGH